MRLIDADSINPADVIGGASEFAANIRKAMQDLIDSQPTAFALEEVLGGVKRARIRVMADKAKEAAGTEETTDQEKEIKRVISYIRSCRDAGIDTTITIDKSRNHFILNALEELEQYRAMEARLNGVSLLFLGEHFLKVAEEGEDEGWQRGRILSNEDADRWDAYNEIGTVEECREARERQQARVPIACGDYHQCPKCQSAEIIGWNAKGRAVKIRNYCPVCGQKLDWSGD